MIEIEQVDSVILKDMMDFMKGNLNAQEKPSVGIFCYSPFKKDFSMLVVKGIEEVIEKNNFVTCSERIKNSDEKYTGRVFYKPSTDEFFIFTGEWLKEYPSIKEMIIATFNLKKQKLNFKTYDNIS